MPKKRKGERPDGLIQVALDIGYNPDGRRKRKYFYGHTRTEANAKRDAYKEHMQSGARYPQGITVGEWVAIFKATYRENVDPAYLGNDDVPYDRLVAALGEMRMTAVSEADLQRALNQTAGMSYSTCDKYRHAIMRVFKRARRNKIIRDDPAEDLLLPPCTRGTHRALESWEVELILSNWDAPGLRAGLWVMLMLLCGLRRSEMMALSWDAVDLRARTLRVCSAAVVRKNQTEIVDRTKTEAGERTIPICLTLYNALCAVPPERRNGLVCRSAHGKQLSAQAVSSGLKTFCAGLERILNGEPVLQRGRRNDIPGKSSQTPRKQFGFRAHDLRHTYATFLYDAGVPVKAAQYFLGHSDIKITLDLYTHLSKEREAASRQQMVQYLDVLLDQRVKNGPETALIPADGGKMVVVPSVPGIISHENA